MWFDANSAGRAANSILGHVYYDYRTHIKHFHQDVVEGFLRNIEVANDRHMSELVPDAFAVATCSTCGDVSLWVNKEIVYPKQVPIDLPNEDMDTEIRELYLEASRIVQDSPKGATALLRLALQLLLKQLGKPGQNINSDIKELVAEGLSPKIQHALDLLRVVGNNAVHPGQIDLNDGRDIALKLFHVLNFIANELLTKPRELALLYADVVPEEARKHIERRDGKSEAV